MSDSAQDPLHPMEEDAPGPPISVPDSGEAGEGGKVKMIVQLVKRCLGVKDIVAMRLSLPASLLDPIPNLEYWHYLDRPDLFAAINDSEDPFERMLAVLRFTFSKDLKFVKGKVCKPYNSVLGEHFRAHWDILPVSYASTPTDPPIIASYTSARPPPRRIHSEVASLESGVSSKRSSSLSFGRGTGASTSTAATSLDAGTGVGAGSGPPNAESGRIRVVFLTEQISHHPPISAFYAVCPARALELRGIDQIAAKVSGTSLRVAPGQHNRGIFVRVTGGFGQGETYHITHPVASVNGILRGAFYVTVGESTIVTCSGGKEGGVRYRAVVEYKDESWLGKAHYLVEGVIHTYTEGDSAHEEWTKVKHVPRELVVAVFDGTWRSEIRWRRVEGGVPLSSSSRVSASGSTLSLPAVSHHAHAHAHKRPSVFGASSSASPSTTALGHSQLIDLSLLEVIPKSVRPLSAQLPRESRKLWDAVTSRLLRKEYGEATREKVKIEQRQRDEAAERKRKGVEFIPRYFERDISSGVAELTEEGRKAVEEEMMEESIFCIEGTVVEEVEDGED